MTLRILPRTLVLALAAAAPSAAWAQAQPQRQPQAQRQLQSQPAAQAQAAAQAQGQQRQPGQVPPAVEPGRPFAPLSTAAQERLDQLLKRWEAESRETKVLSCDFTRWHFDPRNAPAGVHATWAQGTIKYAAPDKGLFRVDTLKMYQGMGPDGKPTYKEDPRNLGEYWVCNGAELMEFDRVEKVCNIMTIPADQRGEKIFQSPLPFVFNLDAAEIQERYWVREVPPPAGRTGIYLIEAWPKTQQDRSQYRFVQIIIGAESFLPEALVLYAPNFDPEKAPVWDQYEFRSVTRNGLVNNFKQFMDSFIKARPPADWKVIRETGVDLQAATPDSTPTR